MDSQSTDLESRVRSLEKEARFYRVVAFGAAVAVAALWIVSASSQSPSAGVVESITAKRIQVVGDDGTIDIRGDHGGLLDPACFGITVTSKPGRESGTISLEGTPSGSASFRARTALTQHEIFIRGDDGSAMLHAGDHSSPGGSLQLSTSGGGGIVMHASYAPMSEAESVGGWIGIYGPARSGDAEKPLRQPRIELSGVGSEYGGGVLVRNKTGESVCTLEADEYGNGRVGAWDRKGKGRTLQPGP